MNGWPSYRVGSHGEGRKGRKTRNNNYLERSRGVRGEGICSQSIPEYEAYSERRCTSVYN